jgi:hypothetical protein
MTPFSSGLQFIHIDSMAGTNEQQVDIAVDPLFGQTDENDGDSTLGGEGYGRQTTPEQQQAALGMRHH